MLWGSVAAAAVPGGSAQALRLPELHGPGLLRGRWEGGSGPGEWTPWAGWGPAQHRRGIHLSWKDLRWLPRAGSTPAGPGRGCGGEVSSTERTKPLVQGILSQASPQLCPERALSPTLWIWGCGSGRGQGQYLGEVTRQGALPPQASQSGVSQPSLPQARVPACLRTPRCWQMESRL